MRTVAFALIVILLLSAHCEAQKILALNKSGKTKRIRYFVNDKINLRFKNEKYILHGNITAIGDSTIDIDNFRVFIKDVVCVYDNEKRGALHNLRKILIYAGAGFAVVDAINRTTQRFYPILDAERLLICGSMVAAGIVLKPLETKRYRINKHHWLQIIDWGENN